MKHITISIVEDIPEVRDSIGRLIQEADEFLLLSSHTNAEAAIQEIPLLQPDIVIMDINLPGLSGIDCIRKIKEDCPSTQFMMYTIFEDDEKIFDALTTGAHGYLLKKTPREKILEALKELYEGGAPMSTHIARKVIRSFEDSRKKLKDNPLLTNKEKETLELLSHGFLYKEIADKLHISTNTLKQHIHNIYEKLHVQNRTEAINKAFGKK